MKVGERVFVSGDSAELWIEDYNVRISTPATVMETPTKNAKKVLLTLDEIDGEHKVCCMVRKSKIEREIANAVEAGLVMVTYNWKCLKEENYLYTLDEFYSRDPEIYDCVTKCPTEWIDGSFSSDKTYSAKLVESYDDLMSFIMGEYNDHEWGHKVEDWYWENCTDDLFDAGPTFSCMMQRVLSYFEED